MKFMKLGSKPDSFETDGCNIRYAARELATDIIVNVGDVKYYLHKFPLLSKSARLQKMVAYAQEENSDEVNISDIPGGPTAFEICAKFCYGMTVTLNAYNVVAARCAAEYLAMHETVDKGNLIYKIEVFLNSSIFRSWKDSIIVLQTTKPLLQLSEELKLVSHCIESIATKACVDVSKVDWSYTYNRKKLQEKNENDLNCNGVSYRLVPKDWWVEDLCELEINFYKRVIVNIKTKKILSNEVIGEALKAYAYRRLSGISKGMFPSGEMVMHRLIVDTIVLLLPAEKGSVSCGFLIKLLKAALFVDLGETANRELVKRIGWQLEEATVNDLMIQSPEGETTIYDVNLVQKILEEFLMQDQNAEIESPEDHEFLEIRRPSILSDASKLMVAKLIDGYLSEITKDQNLPISKFVDLAGMVSGISRPSHDGLYRAIDTYLKEHPGVSKSERKQICRLMDCKKLSVDASMHAVQNERLPLRVVMQVLFFEQVRAAASSGSSTPELPKGIKDLCNGSHGSSRSVTTTADEDWDAVVTSEELEALKGELASLRLGSAVGGVEQNGREKAAKTKGLLMSKNIFMKLWSIKRRQYENNGSNSSEYLGSVIPERIQSTPSRNQRHSVS